MPVLTSGRILSSSFLTALLVVAPLALTACGGSHPQQQQHQTQQGDRAASGSPQALYQEPVHHGPFNNVTPLELVPGGSLGSLGLNLEPLFADRLDSPENRLTRLEATVLAIQSDLHTLAPSMQRMAIVEQDLAAAVAELREVLEQHKTADKTAPASRTTAQPIAKPTAKPAAKPVQKTTSPAPATNTAIMTTKSDGVAGAILPDTGGIATPSQMAGTPSIRGLRLGEHGTKTRLVFDVTSRPTYRTDLDNNERLLVVEMDDVTWGGRIPAALSSPMVQSYTTQAIDDNGGTRIIIQLKKPAKISHEEVLRPEGANTAHRLVLDLE